MTVRAPSDAQRLTARAAGAAAGRPHPLDQPAVLVAMAAILCLIWGSTWFAIKVGLRDMPPFFCAGLRFLGASLLLFTLSRLQRVPGPRSTRAHLSLLALGIGVWAVSYGVVYWGEQYLPAGLTAVLFAVHPLLVSLVAARALPDEPLTARKLAGVVVGFVGIAVIFSDDVALAHRRAPLAAGLLLLSPLLGAVSNVAIKKHAGATHPYTIATLPMLYGGLVMLGASALAEDWTRVSWTGTAVAALAYLTVFGSVLTFVIYYTLLKRVAVSRLALVSYVFPIVALSLDWLLGGQTLGGRAAIGSALVLAGVALAALRRRAAAPPLASA